MIEIAQQDRDMLRFLRIDDSKEIKNYRFWRLPFGLSFSPAILNAVLQHHLQAHNSNAHKQFYVDDGLVSFDSATEGIEQLHTIHNLFSKANFNLH